MNKYNVQFKEVINRSVVVEADTIEEAEQIVMADENGNVIEDSNALDEELLLLRFKLAKIARYTYLVKKRPQNKVFLYGWLNRVLGA